MTREPSVPSAKTRAVVVQDPAVDKLTLLETALDRAGFWEDLASACRRAGVEAAELPILIKPDLAVFDRDAATGTDPVLVEHLIDLLAYRGYSQVVVGDGPQSSDLWLENRDVMILAEMVGYAFVTSQGQVYDVVDLGQDLVEVAFPPGTVLQGTGLGRPWVEAGYRICFAKNKTDEEWVYALCLRSLLSTLPLRNKTYHYHDRLKPWDVCLELLRQTPVDFSIVDAVVSSHGSAGSRIARPLATHTIVASPALLLADWAAALKMGVDPFASPINAKALHEVGLPGGYRIEGSLAPYPGWTNAHPVFIDSTRRRNEWDTVERMIQPWLQPVNQELFPFKELVDERINGFLLRYLADVDDSSTAFWGTVGLNYALSAARESITAFQTLFGKDHLQRVEVPLDLDLSAYSADDYQGVAGYLEPLAELVEEMPADDNGLRWRYLDGSILFELTRVIPVPYDDFVARVDISKAIQSMNDYIGGSAVAVDRDAVGRVTRQAERNLYLPQPNYLVLYQGKVIDVTKLEYIRYGTDDQTIYWRTIKSANTSADYDDGIVSFRRVENGETQVCIFGRQQFVLPLFWQAVNLELAPELKDQLVTQAYTTFFTQTMANFEAQYEGRDVRIGRAWNLRLGEPGSAADEKAAAAQIAALAEKALDFANRNWGSLSPIATSQPRPAATRSGVRDADGFVHFSPVPADQPGARTASAESEEPGTDPLLARAAVAARSFLADLASAMQKDWGIGAADE